MAAKRRLPDQKVLSCGLDCGPAQEDLFPMNGTPDPEAEVDSSDDTAAEWLHVARTEFAMRLGMIAKLKGLGREPVTLRFNGMELILTYVCVIRIPASGHWPAEARLSKAAVKRFIKDYVEPRLLRLAGEKRATVHRFVRGVTARAHELVIERGGDQLIIDGTPLKCTWSAPPV